MAKVSVYNMEGKQIDTIELNDAVFGVEVNEHLVHLSLIHISGSMKRKCSIWWRLRSLRRERLR